MGSAAGRRGRLIEAGLAAAGLVYSAGLAILSFDYTFEARVFALVASLAGIATSLVYLIASLKAYLVASAGAEPVADERAESGHIRVRLVSVSALIVASVAFLYAFGVYPFSFVFTVAFLRAYAGHALRTVLAIATGLTIFNYLMFAVLFDLRFDAVGVLLP